MVKNLIKSLLAIVLIFSAYACKNDNTPVTPPTPPVVEDSGNYAVGHLLATYYGDFFENGTQNWELRFFSEAFVDSGRTSGDVIALDMAAAAESTILNGLPVGEFTLKVPEEGATPSAMEIAGGEIVTYPGEENAVAFTSGTLSITKGEGNIYTIEGVFITAENVEYNFKITRDLDAPESGVEFDDQTYSSDLTGDITQNVTRVFAQYEGDAAGTGTGVWVLHLWGDGAEVSDENMQINRVGSYFRVQLYTELSNSIPEGTFNFVKTDGAIQAGTAEAGLIDGVQVGSWFYQLVEEGIAGSAPADSGEISINSNGDGTYSISYRFGDDNPYNTYYVSSEYSGEVTLIDNTDTGDFAAVSAHYLNNDISASHKSWGIAFQSQEYVDSGTKTGEVIAIVISTRADDSFYSRYLEGSYDLSNVNPNADYSVALVPVAVAFVDGSPRVSTNITSGFMDIVWTGSEYTIELTGVQVEGSTETFDLSYKGVVDFVDYESGTGGDDIVYDGTGTVKAEFYGALPDGGNWTIGFQNQAYLDGATSGTLFMTLDIVSSTNLTFADGMPVGTFEMASSMPAGATGYVLVNMFSAYNYEGQTTDFKSGTVTIEKIDGGDDYKVTLDFVDVNDNSLTGSYTGAVALQDYS